MTRWILLAAAAALFAQKPIPPAVDEKLPLPPPGQPIAFSHKTHIATAKMKCRDCHAIAGDGFQAGLPKDTLCMACHVAVKKDSAEIRKLAAFVKEKRATPWTRIYKVPDIVWFSHAAHVQDKGLACETCHGAVAERDELFKEKPTNMHSCMACHAQHKANNGCDFCHASQ